MPIACCTWARRSVVYVRVQERVAGPAAQDEAEFPGQVGGVAESGAHALAGEGRHEVGRVAREQDAPDPPLGRVPGLEGVDGVMVSRPSSTVRRRRPIRIF